MHNMNVRNFIAILFIPTSLGFNFLAPLQKYERTAIALRRTGGHFIHKQIKKKLPPLTHLFESDDPSNFEKRLIDVDAKVVENKNKSTPIGTENKAKTKEKENENGNDFAYVDNVFRNINSGEFGKRGESYFAVQVALVLCILYGNIPMLGDLITFLFGPCLVFLGIGVALLGLRGLGSNLSPWPMVLDDSSLVKNGVYAEVRHPIYAGLLYFCLGLSIWTGSAMRVLMTALLWYLLEQKSNFEERQLVEKFNQEYEDYQADVGGKFVPDRLAQAMPWSADDERVV